MLSVIIPALNEERALPATLDSLLAQTGDFEVIVVDGGSTDTTLQVVRQRPRVRLLTAPAGRGLQMNAGAREAAGEMLLFLHADTLLPPGWLAELGPAGGVSLWRWGGFQQRFSGQMRTLRLVSGLHNLRCRMTNVFYGDQAMFVHRDMFWSVGGFDEQPLLEDIRLSERLKKIQPPDFLPLAVITDSRKFEQLGPVRALLHCLLILTCYELRLPILGRRFFGAFR